MTGIPKSRHKEDETEAIKEEEYHGKSSKHGGWGRKNIRVGGLRKKISDGGKIINRSKKRGERERE